MITLRRFNLLTVPSLAVAMVLVCGCGDETTRMSGTIDLPKKEHSQPVVKKVVKNKSNVKTAGHP
jgi:hypothetical protein